MMLRICMVSVSVLLVPALGFPQSLLTTPRHPAAEMFWPNRHLPAAPSSPLLAAFRPSPYESDRSLQRQEAKSKRVVSTPSTSPAEDEVVWGECSPRLAWTRRTQDAQLHCEVVVSSGTRVTWYKGNHLLQRQGVAEEADGMSLQEAMEEQTNRVGLGPSSATHLLSSRVYLDCINDQDSGDYSMEVRTAANNVYFQNFTVYITEMTQRGPSCALGTRVMAFVPRIFHFSHRVEVTPGASVTLPCRAQGHQLTLAWYINNTPLDTTSADYQVLVSGDLVITRFNQQGTTVYECRVISTINSNLRDSIFTIVFPQVDTS